VLTILLNRSPVIALLPTIGKCNHHTLHPIIAEPAPRQNPVVETYRCYVSGVDQFHSIARAWKSHPYVGCLQIDQPPACPFEFLRASSARSRRSRTFGGMGSRFNLRYELHTYCSGGLKTATTVECGRMSCSFWGLSTQ
jgi:hypothetical protein